MTSNLKTKCAVTTEDLERTSEENPAQAPHYSSIKWGIHS